MLWKKSTSLSFFLSLDEEIRSADAFNTLTADDAFLTAWTIYLLVFIFAVLLYISIEPHFRKRYETLRLHFSINKMHHRKNNEDPTTEAR